MDSPFRPKTTASSRVRELHIHQVQFLAADHLGMRMVALGARTVDARAVERVAAILAVMPNRQDLHRELRAFRHRAPRCNGKISVQAIKVEDTASANSEMNSGY